MRPVKTAPDVLVSFQYSRSATVGKKTMLGPNLSRPDLSVCFLGQGLTVKPRLTLNYAALAGLELLIILIHSFFFLD